MSRIACPYCCTIQTFPDANVCKNCGEEVPENYLRAAKVTSPFYMAVVGMSSHGKTAFIHSLTSAMDNLGKISRGAFLSAIDDHTAAELKLIRQKIAKREVTTATKPRPKGVYLQEPMVFTLRSFMAEDRNTLVIYDIAGEAFSDRAEIQQYADPLKLANTVWFMISLHDLQHANSEYSTIADLFNVYITGMERAGANPRGRHLHVVYTKADKITELLPNEILEYVREDQYSNLSAQSPRDLQNKQFERDNYIYELEQMSHRLREYTEYDVPSGMTFVNMVEDYQMTLSFSINTALGGDPTPNRQIDYDAHRVLDPLVWVLRENAGLGPSIGGIGIGDSKYGEQEIALILDNGFSSKNKIYGLGLPAQFFTELMEYGSVKTFYLGTTSPMTTVGVEPTNAAPSKETLPLIGPILDQLSENARAVLITSQRVGDMLDFHTTDWHQRLGIITFEQPYEVRRNDPWPRSMVFDRSAPPSAQIKTIVKKLFNQG